MPSDDEIITQLRGDPPRSIAARVLPEDFLHLRRELILTFGTLSPSIVPAAAQAEQTTQNRRWISGRLARDDMANACCLNSSSYLRRRRVVLPKLRVDSNGPFFMVVSLIF
jgi:hypothetical protein